MSRLAIETHKIDASPAGDLLGDLDGIELSSASLTILDPALPVSDWEALVRRLALNEGSVAWWLGDALVYGDRYGLSYAEIAAKIGRAEQTLKNCAWVARRVPPEQRDPTLPWRLHREVARLEPEAQPAWLKRTRAEGWVAEDLRREMLRADLQQGKPPAFDPSRGDDQNRLDQVQVTCPECGHTFSA